MWKTLGQQRTINLLEKTLQVKSIAHAYLLYGPEHIGKNTLAYDFAMAINCQGEKVPCGQCNSCRRIMNRKHADVIYISPVSSIKNNGNGQSNKKEISIEDIRRLQQLASIPPYEGNYKVFIIDGADFLSNEAANCLLKTLEEPLPHIVIILLAGDKTGILPTIISRCQQIELKPLSTKTIEDYLLQQKNVDYERAKLIARLSQGSLGAAISASADENFFLSRENTITDICSLACSNPGERLSYVSSLEKTIGHSEQKKVVEQLLACWIIWWRDVMLIKSNCSGDIVNLDKVNILKEFSSLFDMHEINHFIAAIRKSLSIIALNANIRLALEVLMFHMPFGAELKAIIKQDEICQK